MAKAPPNGETTGHNSLEQTEGERRALFSHHFQSVHSQFLVVEREKEELKRRRKLARVDGIAGKELDYGIRVATVGVENPEIIIEEQLRRAEIARWMGLPVGEQAAFDFEREPVNDRARREGAAAAYKGQERTPPFAPDSRPGQAWLKAYDKANEQRLTDLANALEKKEREAQAAALDDEIDDGAHDPERVAEEA